MPKANGYEALHSTVMGPDGVWVEVQIRTQRMEDIAERGFAAHWKYKQATISQDEDEFDKWLKQIRDGAEQSPTENAVDFLDNFKLSLYTSEIVVFTPKGEPRRSCPSAPRRSISPTTSTPNDRQQVRSARRSTTSSNPITTQIIERRPDRDHHGRQRPVRNPNGSDIVDDGEGEVGRSRASSNANGRTTSSGACNCSSEKMKPLEYPSSAARVLRKIVPIYESNNKEELYSKIGAGIVSLDDLDKVLKVNSKSKILKLLDALHPQKGRRRATTRARSRGDRHSRKSRPTNRSSRSRSAANRFRATRSWGIAIRQTGKIIVHKATCDELNRLAAQFGRKTSSRRRSNGRSTRPCRTSSRPSCAASTARASCWTWRRSVSDDFNINIREVNIHSHDGIFEGSA